MRRLLSIAILAAATSAAYASPPPMFRPLIMEAINSPSGTASKKFDADEQWVKLARYKFGTDGPITVTAKVIKRYKEPGCARVSNIIVVHDAVFKNGYAQDGVPFSVDLDVCENGMPPNESMDLQSLQAGIIAKDRGVSQGRPVINVEPLDINAPAVPLAPQKGAERK